MIPGNIAVILPAQEAPAAFPHAADVLVLGCRRADHLEALLVAILSPPKSVILRSQPGHWSCVAP